MKTTVIWSKDGAQIYFTSSHVDEPYYELPKTELYSIAATGGEPTKITTIRHGHERFRAQSGWKTARVRRLGQSSRSIPTRSPILWVIDLTPNAKPRNLTSGFDWDIASGVFGDNGRRAPAAAIHRSGARTERASSKLSRSEGRTNIGRFDATSGALTEITKGDQAVARFRATADGSKIVYLLSTPTRLGDLFSLDQRGDSRSNSPTSIANFSRSSI